MELRKRLPRVCPLPRLEILGLRGIQGKNFAQRDRTTTLLNVEPRPQQITFTKKKEKKKKKKNHEVFLKIKSRSSS